MLSIKEVDRLGLLLQQIYLLIAKNITIIKYSVKFYSTDFEIIAKVFEHWAKITLTE